MRAVITAMTTLGLAACATAYTEPSASAASASVTFARSPSVPRWGHTQTLHSVSDERCTSRSAVKEFVPLGSQNPHAFRVEAGSRRYFWAETTQTQGGAHGFTDTTCANVISFVPEAGRTYTLTHSRGLGGCSIEVVDAETKSAPTSFVAHPYDRKCVRIW